ncbi:YfdX family protein [Rickettsia endosymbiont of Urophora cardui]|uniref:YfdX family protein n=1 Tax=Rickettsia endosymbiont of Urophora cardui TaxID=3066265 RepID=UPI00313AC533
MYKYIFKFLVYSSNIPNILRGFMFIILCYAPTVWAQSKEIAHSAIEQQHQQVKQQMEEAIVQDAVTVIDNTKKAISYLKEGKEKEAIATIEYATGKVNILLARRPENALLPISSQVILIDAAPQKISNIRNISKAAEKAIKEKNYPHSRVLLNILRDEINIHTYNLPLATYPSALKTAARLIEEKKSKAAIETLENALVELVSINRTIPLPIIHANIMSKMAEENYKTDKEIALNYLASARDNLERAKELGYTGNDSGYNTLIRSIKDLEKQIKSNKNSDAAFVHLKTELSEFLKRLSDLVVDI